MIALAHPLAFWAAIAGFLLLWNLLAAADLYEGDGSIGATMLLLEFLAAFGLLIFWAVGS